MPEVSDTPTVTLDQLPVLAALSPDALTIAQEPSGPMGRVSIKTLLGRLISTDTAKTTRALLYADLAHDASAIALVYADPTAALNGWYRKAGASGTGAWAQFEKLSAQAAAEVQAAIDAAATTLEGYVTSAGDLVDHANLLMRSAATTVATIGDREDIPVEDREYGLHVYVAALEREFVWTEGAGMGGADDWVGLHTDPELLNRGNHTGTQDQDTINGLPDALDAIDVTISTRFSGTIAQRGGLAPEQLVNGLRYFVTDISPPRQFQWVTEGATDPYGVTASEDGWVGLNTLGEIKNLGIDFTGTLPAANVEHLPTALSDVTSLFAIQIADFKAEALSIAASPLVNLSWGIKGTLPDSQAIAWGGHSVMLDGKARGFAPPDWSATKQVFVVGNSLSDVSQVTTRWSQLFASARDVNLVSVARYSSDASQVYRCGAAPIFLSISGGALPASGTSASITQINGAAPSSDLSVNPASFLNTGDASLTVNCSMTGWIGDRHVTVSIPNAASTAYAVVQAGGGAAVTLPGAVLFIPDPSLQLDQSDVIIWMGNNYFYSGVANTYGDHTNPQLWIDLAAIVARARGNRVLMLPVIPDSSWATTGAGNPYAAMLAANARTESLFPAFVARDATGRTLLQRLQASGNGSTNDNADIAAGFVPRSLHATGDTLHLNSAGDVVVEAFVAEAFAAQTLPPAITQGTTFTLVASGTQASTGTVARDTAVAAIEAGIVAKTAVGGPLANGAWVKLPAIYALVLNGTGTVTLDSKTRAGAITTGAASYSPSGTETVAYPYFGAPAAYARATLSGTATAEII